MLQRFSMISVIWFGSFLLLGTAANEICYERIGCFSDRPPWSGISGRHLFGLPQSPESMNISFSLFTRETRNLSQKIVYTDGSTIKNSNFSPWRKTYFVIHGLSSTGKYGWVVEMCLLLVKVENVNCIAVDWEEGAKHTYFTSASNIRVLGAVIAYLIDSFKKMYWYAPTKVHLIGHSLGAHTAGEVGRRLKFFNGTIPRIQRITGLDPAGYGFEGMPDKVRLDPSDAKFVDVIHSNGAKSPVVGFGMLNVTGDLDFYPNGGTVMPGCNIEAVTMSEDEDEASLKVANRSGIGNCHHSRSHEYYRYSILYPKGFAAYPCESYKSFQKGECFPCPREGCPLMGHYADRFRYKLRKNNPLYYLNTGPKEPFISWRYNVSIKLYGMNETKGGISIIFYDREGGAKEYQIKSGDLKQNETYSKLIDVEIDPAIATRVEFIWQTKSMALHWTQLGAEKVVLVNGYDGSQTHFCGTGTVKYGFAQILKSC